MLCLLGVHAATLAELSSPDMFDLFCVQNARNSGLVDVDITSGVGDRNLFDLITSAAAPLVAVRGSSSSAFSATAWPRACAAGGTSAPPAAVGQAAESPRRPAGGGHAAPRLGITNSHRVDRRVAVVVHIRANVQHGHWSSTC
jgi:hypothetical protein